METKTLVTYATQYGATKEIAEKIGDGLRQAGLQTDVLPVDSVRDLTAYQAVILGSGVYIGQWNKKASAFLQANEKSLAERKVWLFSSGPTGEGDPNVLLKGWRLPSGLKPVADRIQPCGITVFHGYINPGKLNFLQKWVIKNMVKAPFGDFRDWDAIAAWTRTVSSELKAAEPV